MRPCDHQRCDQVDAPFVAIGLVDDGNFLGEIVNPARPTGRYSMLYKVFIQRTRPAAPAVGWSIWACTRVLNARRFSRRSSCQMPKRTHSATPATTRRVASSQRRLNMRDNECSCAGVLRLLVLELGKAPGCKGTAAPPGSGRSGTGRPACADGGCRADIKPR